MKKILVSCIIAYFLLSCSQSKFSVISDNQTDFISIKLLKECFFEISDLKSYNSYPCFLGIYNNEVYLFLAEDYDDYLNKINETRSTGITLEDSIKIIPRYIELLKKKQTYDLKIKKKLNGNDLYISNPYAGPILHDNSIDVKYRGKTIIKEGIVMQREVILLESVYSMGYFVRHKEHGLINPTFFFKVYRYIESDLEVDSVVDSFEELLKYP